MTKTLTNIERAERYLTPREDQIKIFAGFAKLSGRSAVLFYETEPLLNLLAAESNVFRFKEDGVRWAGPMMNRIDQHAEFARLTINCPWNKFQVGSNGYMSDAQEQAVLAALTGPGSWFIMGDPATEPERYQHNAQLVHWLRNLPWRWTGHNHRRGVHDLTATITLSDGRTLEIVVEVKGVNGRVFYS